MKVCVLLGPPGAGKGTQASLLASRLGALHISSGNIIRGEIAAASPVGLKVKSVVESGQLVEDKLLFECCASYFDKLDKKVPFLLLDGVPRTLPQVDMLDKTLEKLGLKVDIVLGVTAPLEKLVERFSKRWTCSKCGAIASFDDAAVASAATCSKCGSVATYQRRKDDAPEAVKTRFSVYEAETAPLIQVYRQRGLLQEVDGLRQVEHVYVDVASRLLAI